MKLLTYQTLILEKSIPLTNSKAYSVTAMSLRYLVLKSVKIYVSSAYYSFSKSRRATDVVLSDSLYAMNEVN